MYQFSELLIVADCENPTSTLLASLELSLFLSVNSLAPELTVKIRPRGRVRVMVSVSVNKSISGASELTDKYRYPLAFAESVSSAYNLFFHTLRYLTHWLLIFCSVDDVNSVAYCRIEIAQTFA